MLQPVKWRGHVSVEMDGRRYGFMVILDLWWVIRWCFLFFFVLGILLRLHMKLLNLLKFLDCLKRVSLMPRSFFFVNDVCFPGQIPLIHHDLSLSGKKASCLFIIQWSDWTETRNQHTPEVKHIGPLKNYGWEDYLPFWDGKFSEASCSTSSELTQSSECWTNQPTNTVGAPRSATR